VSKPKVSIVIPVYNEEAYIGACLASVVSQSVSFDEIIVVNNNSSDGTLEVISDFPEVLVFHEKRQGRSYAQDTGFSSASGDWVARIDADTRLAGDWCEQLHNLIASSPSAAAWTGRGTFYDAPFGRAIGWAQTAVYQWLQLPAMGSWTLWGSLMAIQRQAWQDVAPVCQSRSDLDEDIDLTIHLRCNGYRVGYSSLLRGEMSLRRGDTGFFSTLKYLRSWPQDYMSHGRIFAGVYVSLLAGLVCLPAAANTPLRFIASKISKRSGVAPSSTKMK